MLVDPNSGEIIDSLDTKRIRAVINQLSADIDKHWRAIDDLRDIRNLFEEELPPAAFPPPSRRTSRQEAVARCPKCSQRYGLTLIVEPDRFSGTNEGGRE
jgi:hypothetical protein